MGGCIVFAPKRALEDGLMRDNGRVRGRGRVDRNGESRFQRAPDSGTDPRVWWKKGGGGRIWVREWLSCDVQASNEPPVFGEFDIDCEPKWTKKKRKEICDGKNAGAASSAQRR